MPGISPTSSSTQSKSLIEQQASRWFVLIRSETCTTQDVRDHQAWLSHTTIHQLAYRELEDMWAQVGGFIDKPEIRDACKRLKTSGPNLGDRLGSDVALPQSSTVEPINQGLFDTKVMWWRSFAITTSLIVALMCVGQLMQGSWLRDWFRDSWSVWNADPIYQTKIGEQKKVNLVDGSSLILDTQTTVIEKFSNTVRLVILERGRAKFDVASDEHRPFIVKAGNGSIAALGTEFVVKKSREQVFVTLIEGRVEVTPLLTGKGLTGKGLKEKGLLSTRDPVDRSGIGDSPEITNKIQLSVGQQVSYTDQGVSLTKDVDLLSETSWQDGRLVFSDYTLAQVVDELNRYSKNKIILGDQSLAQRRVTGVFKAGETQKAIRALQAYFSLKVSTDPYGNQVLSSISSQ
jgi:transmembrane sensor